MLIEAGAKSDLTGQRQQSLAPVERGFPGEENTEDL